MHRMLGYPAQFALFLAVGSALGGCEASLQAQAGGAAAVEPGLANQPASGQRACENPNADLGAPPAIKGNEAHITLDCGTYHGDLEVKGNDMTVEGAGAEMTIIDGRLIMKGNDNTLRGFTVTGPSEVKGNDNTLSGTQFRAGVAVDGHDNTQ